MSSFAAVVVAAVVVAAVVEGSLDTHGHSAHTFARKATLGNP